jgi:large subunit ribosomal protein L21
VAYNDGSSLQLGKPTLAGVAVSAKVLGVAQGPKLVVQKFRRRKGYRRRVGHRQLFTKVKIDKIMV